MSTEANSPPAGMLQIYWYEIKPSEQWLSARGEFSGAIGRLVDLEEQLRDVMKQRDVAKRLRRLTLIVEGYLSRAYELRERAIGLLGTVTGHRALAKRCKKPSERTRCMQKLRAKHPLVAESVDRLLSELDSDIDLRNTHTHEQLLSIGFWVAGGPYDVEDILMEVETWTTEQRRETLAALRGATRGLVREYRKRVRAVIDAAHQVAEAAYETLPDV